jgi:hypothetical protein
MILPYDVLRRADDPRAVVLEFAQSTYEAGARAAGWDIEGLTYAPAVQAPPKSAPRHPPPAGEGAHVNP